MFAAEVAWEAKKRREKREKSGFSSPFIPNTVKQLSKTQFFIIRKDSSVCSERGGDIESSSLSGSLNKICYISCFFLDIFLASPGIVCVVCPGRPLRLKLLFVAFEQVLQRGQLPV